VKLRGSERLSLTYKYELAPERTLADYDMEQQGNLLADYWAFMWGNGTPGMVVEKQHKNDFALFKTVLASFIADPSDKRNLPSYFKRYEDKRDRRFVEGRSKF